MDFTSCLVQQIRLHGPLEPEDVMKLCFQASYGASHLIEDPDHAWLALRREAEAVEVSGGPLAEEIGGSFHRISLPAWKGRALPLGWLFRMMTCPQLPIMDAEGRFSSCLEAAGEVIRKEEVGFSVQDWESFLRAYLAQGIRSVHHSAQYREREKPSYRVVDAVMVRTVPVLERLATMSKEHPLTIAIDGRAASGKTSLAQALHQILDADLIHMDDFFLPKELRSPERFRTPGGNVHYERFVQEVLPQLAKGKPFSYRIFDCSRMDYSGLREVGEGSVRIVEGSYCMHKAFGDYADLKVWCDVTPQEQRRRIRIRNGEEGLAVFQERWIPLEEAYFAAQGIREAADLVV